MEGHLEITVRKYLDSNKLDVPSFLTISIGLAELIGKLHQAGEMKITLSPDHIVYHPETGQLELHDLQTILSPALYSKYAYMSPEQTGRMNRTIDGRSHLYVLGIILYEMLTGHLPFQAETAAEWVYAHMAMHPQPLFTPHFTIPQIICDIVMKLLSKSAEDRFQSSYGLRMDLERCLVDWRINDRVESFVLGQSDALIRFQIPQTLYGRGRNR